MPVLNRVAELHEEVTGWRREIHSNPELLYDVHETAAKVADMLKTGAILDAISILVVTILAMTIGPLLFASG